jgi:hypothetical protein
MPRYNSRREIVGARTTDWLTDDVQLTQFQLTPGDDASWRLGTRTPGGAVVQVPGSVRGANILSARLGRWMARADRYGLYDATGLVSPTQTLVGDIQSGRGATAADGTVGIILDQPSGRGLRLMAMDGSAVDVPDAVPRNGSTCILNATQALWVDFSSGRVQTCGGLPVPEMQPGFIGWPCVLKVGEAWWVAYQSTDALGVILHAFADAAHGYKLPWKAGYYLDAAADGSRLYVTGGLTADDAPTEEFVVDVASEPMIAFADVAAPPVVPLGRSLTVNTAMRNRPDLAPTFCNMRDWRNPDFQWIDTSWWWDTNKNHWAPTPGELTDPLWQKANAGGPWERAGYYLTKRRTDGSDPRGVPASIYFDMGFDDPRLLAIVARLQAGERMDGQDDADLLSFMIYPLPGDVLGPYGTRVIRALRQMVGLKLAPWFRVNDAYGAVRRLTEDEIVGFIGLYGSLWRQFVDILVAQFWCDDPRSGIAGDGDPHGAGGCSQYPKVMAAIERELAAIPGPVDLGTIAVVAPPVVVPPVGPPASTDTRDPLLPSTDDPLEAPAYVDEKRRS